MIRFQRILRGNVPNSSYIAHMGIQNVAHFAAHPEVIQISTAEQKIEGGINEKPKLFPLIHNPYTFCVLRDSEESMGLQHRRKHGRSPYKFDPTSFNQYSVSIATTTGTARTPHVKIIAKPAAVLRVGDYISVVIRSPRVGACIH